MGCIYKNGSRYWIKYYKQGRPFYESSRSTKEADAKRLLRLREGEISEGRIPGIVFDRVTFEELAEGYLMDYRLNGRKSLRHAGISIRHLAGFFGGMRIPEISSPRIGRYIEMRLEEGVKPSTINRELAALKRMLNLGARQTPPKVGHVPYIPMLKENNIRKGFFEHGDFLTLRSALPEYLKGFVTFGYKTGWRISEIKGLIWSQVDLQHGVVRLEPGETKNDQGRMVYLDDELREVFARQWEIRKRTGKIIPYVFANRDGTGSIRDFRRAWDTACKEAQIGKRLFHDLRRTAIRNMIRSGTSERVAMMVSGHRTRAVFDRYNIVSDTDLRLAATRQEEYLHAQIVIKKVIVGDFQKDHQSPKGPKDSLQPSIMGGI